MTFALIGHRFLIGKRGVCIQPIEEPDGVWKPCGKMAALHGDRS